MTFQKHLARQGRSKVPVMFNDVGDGHLSHMRPQPAIGGPAAGPVTKASHTLIGKLTLQPMRLAPGDASFPTLPVSVAPNPPSVTPVVASMTIYGAACATPSAPATISAAGFVTGSLSLECMS
jgi:hypothetical protein